MTLTPTARKTASNAAVKLASRSCRTNFTLIACTAPELDAEVVTCGLFVDHGKARSRTVPI
jgi:hypothetical protein